jgi:hypothetical protein
MAINEVWYRNNSKKYGQNGTQIDRISFAAPCSIKPSKERSATNGVAYLHSESY